jgi:hypothetical protein
VEEDEKEDEEEDEADKEDKAEVEEDEVKEDEVKEDEVKDKDGGEVRHSTMSSNVTPSVTMLGGRLGNNDKRDDEEGDCECESKKGVDSKKNDAISFGGREDNCKGSIELECEMVKVRLGETVGGGERDCEGEKMLNWEVISRSIVVKRKMVHMAKRLVVL